MTQVVSGAFTVQIVANAYASLLPDTATRVYTGSTAKIAAGYEPEIGILSYSGMAYDSANGQIYVFGGGHECWNNEVWQIGVDGLPTNPSAQWTKHYSMDHPGYPGSQTPPDTIANVYADTNFATYPGMWLSSSRPIARHTRHSICWLPSEGKFICSGSSMSGALGLGTGYIPVAGYPGDGQEVWTYNPSALPGNGWAWKGSTLVNPGYNGRPDMAVYHTGRDRLYTTGKAPESIGGTMNSNNQAYFAEYDPTSNTWTKHYNGSNSSAITSRSDTEYIMPACDPVGDRIICLLYSAGIGLQVLAYDIAARAWSDKTSLMTGDIPPHPEEGDSVVYSTESGSLVYFRGHGSVYYLNCSTWAWTAASFSLPNVAQILGCTAYCPTRKVAFIAFANRSSTGVDIYAARV